MLAEPKIYVVDDSADWCDSLKWLFGSVGLQVETFCSAQDFLENYDKSELACLILDVRMPGMSGIQLQDELTDNAPYLHIIFLSGHASVSMAVNAMKKGAIDFLEKPVDEQKLLDRVQEVMKKISGKRHNAEKEATLTENLKQLTAREQQVLKQLLQGHQTRSIADNLCVSMRTVEAHRAKILMKTGYSSTAELVIWLKTNPRALERE